ncbi:Ribose-1,5-bisphosphate isomerase [Thermofilum adornatum 1505]|uniref:Translation initiation factor eIF2B subunit delta n=1 Tax=Thermofilum adornatum 1505 TaxID=697581 RepID=A0A3G1A6T1_9CREN|nr:Ribose-1,5-bisphosphate isomerase [Thermofilum adornatum 1505]
METELDKVINGRIYSSTETVIYTLELLGRILKENRNPTLFVNSLERILKARPTASMLQNAVRLLTNNLAVTEISTLDDFIASYENTRQAIVKKIFSDIEESSTIASRRLANNDTVMTNSYSLFVKRTIEKAVEEGKKIKVYVTESRPTGEGVKFAAELSDKGIETYLIVDSAVRFFMKEVDKVLLSSEAISANGAVVNKIGTSLIALAAHEARVRVYVVSSTFKFSPETLVGELVEIPEIEISEYMPEGWEKLKALKPKSPLFDVTPPSYIDAIITEKGVIAPEFAVMMFRESFGWPHSLAKYQADIDKLKEKINKLTG